mgnify:CR=1 FL=1
MSEKEILLTAILKCQRAELYSGRLVLTEEQREKLSYYLSLRAQGVPLQYILGETEFFGFRFKVDKRVLIPRPETEILVEAVIRRTSATKRWRTPDRALWRAKDEGCRTTDCESRITNYEPRILDIGAGSGCIAVALAKSLPDARVTAVDISCQALELARENALLNGVSDRINFIQSDLFPPTAEAFDIIVSNPPYVCSQEIEKLSLEVRNEPRLALDGGNDGLSFYRGIIPRAGRLLKNGGFLALEMGFLQRQGIEEIIKSQDRLRLKEVIKDYSDIERIMVMEKWIN